MPSPPRAICLRCGAAKAAPEGICPACGHRPEGEGLLVAWLLSDAHLPPERLEAAAVRIREGQSVRPSAAMLDKARRALGLHAHADPGLSRRQRLGLLASSLLFTALPGVVLWAWWRQDRPRSARQALWLSLPAGAITTAAVIATW